MFSNSLHKTLSGVTWADQQKIKRNPSSLQWIFKSFECYETIISLNIHEYFKNLHLAIFFLCMHARVVWVRGLLVM